MSDTALKEDNINSLCKKYYTPELCKEPVTETKRTLELKLWTQLEKYGHKVSQNYSALTSEDCEDVIIYTIGECFKNWKDAIPKATYSAYYSGALTNNFTKKNAEVQKRNNDEVSLQKQTSQKDTKLTLGDKLENIQDKNKKENEQALNVIVEQLDVIEKAFSDRVQKGREDKNTANCRAALLTLELKEDFLKWGYIIKGEYGRNYSFIDKRILKMSDKLNKNKVAALFGINPTRATHILQDFLKEVKAEK